MPLVARGSGHPISRRTVLTAALLAPALSGCTSLFAGPTTITGTLSSAATGSNHDWAIWYPTGTGRDSGLPVVLVLHGLGDTIASIEPLGYTSQASALIDSGAAPFAIAAINGDTLFWQKLGDQDAGAMVAEEFLPVLADHGLDIGRLALTGWSMGGWGTLRLAERELRGKLRAAAAISTPCYADYRWVPAPYQKLMSRSVFEAGNFYNHPERLTDLPLFLACGTEDPFEAGNEDFVITLDSQPGVIQPTRVFSKGAHDADYWRSAAPAQFRFLADHLG